MILCQICFSNMKYMDITMAFIHDIKTQISAHNGLHCQLSKTHFNTKNICILICDTYM